jgi:hypothetical protein
MLHVQKYARIPVGEGHVERADGQQNRQRRAGHQYLFQDPVDDVLDRVHGHDLPFDRLFNTPIIA